MKNSIIIVLLLAVSSAIGVYSAYDNSKTFTVRNNDTRNYQYEHYCDSIYEVNPNYYFDVLVESDKFQSYIDKHGEWWTN